MRRRLLYTLLALVAAALVIWLVEPLHTALGHVLHGDVDALQAQLQSLGVWGGFVVVALILAHAVIFFPAEIVNATAGLAFGFWVAFPIVLRLVGRRPACSPTGWAGSPGARSPSGWRGRSGWRAPEGLIDRSGAPALLLSRLVPFVPFSLVGYLAGAARVPVWRYTWTTFGGRAADHRRGDVPGPRARRPRARRTRCCGSRSA